MKIVNEESFISGMLDETYQVFSDSEDAGRNDIFYHDFVFALEKKLMTGEIKHYSELVHTVGVHTFRMFCGNQIYDFPDNWSFFQNINYRLSQNCATGASSHNAVAHLIIDEKNDNDCLREIFNSVFKIKNHDICILMSGQQLYFVLFDKINAKEFSEWLKVVMSIDIMEDKKGDLLAA